MHGKILLHVRWVPLYVRISFNFGRNLAVDISLGTLFIHRFIRRIFLSEQKVVPLHSHAVAIYISTKISKSSNSTTAVVSTPIGNADKTDIDMAETLAAVHMALLALLQPQTECRCEFRRLTYLLSHDSVIATLSASGIYTVEARIFERTCRLMLLANGVVDVLPSLPFYSLIFNSSAEALHLPKQMVIAYATGPLPSVTTASSALRHQLPIGTPREFGSVRVTHNHSACWEAEHHTALSEALQAKYDNFHNILEAVYYKPFTVG